MAKKFSTLLVLLAIILMPSETKAYDSGCCDSNFGNFFSDILIEGKVSAFIPTERRARREYNDAIPFYQFEISKTFCNNFNAWLDIGYLTERGHRRNHRSEDVTVGGGGSGSRRNRNRLEVVPLSFGLRYIYPLFECVDVYLGGGAVYSWFHLKERRGDNSDSGRRRTNRETWGGVVKFGFNYNFSECLYVDVFVDYLFQELRLHRRREFTGDVGTVGNEGSRRRHRLNFDGVNVGAGIGFRF